MGRVRRGEKPDPRSRHSAFRRLWAVPLLVGLAAVLAIVFLDPEPPVTVDRCCYDLDGGGTADDGAFVIAQRDGRVYRLSVYEDRDGSGTLTPADIVRFERGGMPLLDQFVPTGLVSIRHCCHDLDGGGPPDDGILVHTTPPDRVHSAGIYELR